MPSPSAITAWTDFLTRAGLLGGTLCFIWLILNDTIITAKRHNAEMSVRDKAYTDMRQAADAERARLETALAQKTTDLDRAIEELRNQTRVNQGADATIQALQDTIRDLHARRR
jgi:hypothetical protein